MTSPVTSLAPLPDRAVRTHTPQSRSVSAAITNTTGSADIDPASDPTSPQGESKQLRKNKSLVQLRDAADQPLLPYPPEKKERERSLTKFLAQRRAEKEVKTKSVPITVGWGIGEGQDIQRGSAAAWHGFRLRPDGSGIGFDSSIVQVNHASHDQRQDSTVSLIHAGFRDRTAGDPSTVIRTCAPGSSRHRLSSEP